MASDHSTAPAVPGAALLIAFHAESGVHAGSGATLAYVDLPIQRESFTGIPILYASTVKGALRDHCENTPDKQRDDDRRKQLDALFGPESTEAAGLALVQEARLLLLPVRSRKGIFAWVTCPLQLERLRRDIQAIRPYLSGHAAANADRLTAIEFPSVSEGEAQPSDAESLVQSGAIWLEDFKFSLLPIPDGLTTPDWAQWLSEWLYATPAGKCEEWWKDRLSKHMVLLNDEDFLYFAEMHLTVETHIQIGDKGNVTNGPWNEEYLPADSVLSSTITVPDPIPGSLGAEVFPDPGSAGGFTHGELPHGARIRIGGKQSLAKGLVRLASLGQPPAQAEVAGSSPEEPRQ